MPEDESVLDAPNASAAFDTFAGFGLDAKGKKFIQASAFVTSGGFMTFQRPTHAAKEGISLHAARNLGAPSPLATYNIAKEIFELANTARANERDFETGFGCCVVGPFNDDLARPVGATLPARVFEFDGQSTQFLSTPCLPGEPTSTYNGAKSAGGVTMAANTNNGLRYVHHLFVPFTNYSEVAGYTNSNGAGSEGGLFTPTQKDTIETPATGEGIFVRFIGNDAAVAWMEYMQRDIAVIQGLLGLEDPFFDTIPAPTGLTASPGTNPGEIDISWTGGNSTWASETLPQWRVYLGPTSQDVSDRRAIFVEDISSPYTIAGGLLQGETYFVAVSMSRITGGPSNPLVNPQLFAVGMDYSGTPLSNIDSVVTPT